ncbi:hypothetical protein POSPLADRAFT_1057020 [Postia placenta MAD-698-R-SB12]|uniref:Uncharacterized protein n=1 Tax=Postia placenta MAD-698-R-SB12 TaxID=670580 RepID=A0A1X6N1P5_9APHY|nr:hypothetical protein POSPLADRAFT_1057020 [Postia placenta MAD-698-R-SB12]OSX62430.1 hypothetical protein POSPLADRAFT_1057020 [Postia placenta MAD-698-R-SB12]
MSQSASHHFHPVSPSSCLPRLVTGPSQMRGDPDLPADPVPEPEPTEGEEGDEDPKSLFAVSSSPSWPISLHPIPFTSTVPDSHAPSLSPGSSPTPLPISTATPMDKEMLKLLIPTRYDGKTVQECNRFLAMLKLYWAVNTFLSTINIVTT